MAKLNRMSKGVLLVNLGSPNSTSVKDVRNYLDEFLMDPRVIDLPYLSRALLVKGIILRTRPKKSAAAYQKVWTPEGSPLIVHTRKLTEKVQAQLSIPVQMAMRYGNPSIASAIEALSEKGVSEILLVPLYPQYAMSTTETISVLAHKIVKKKYPHISPIMSSSWLPLSRNIIRKGSTYSSPTMVSPKDISISPMSLGSIARLMISVAIPSPQPISIATGTSAMPLPRRLSRNYSSPQSTIAPPSNPD